MDTETLKAQINFFIAYSGRQKENSIENAVNEAVEKAYNDAKRVMSNISVDDKKEALRKIKDIAIDYFTSGKDNWSDQAAFDKKHEELCKAWCHTIKQEHLNTYGKAQKIVNLMFKYMYCYAFLNSDLGLKGAFEHCHIPLDSYTLAWLSRQKKIDGITSKTVWSKLNRNTYKDIIASVRKLNFPCSLLEAEFFFWDYQMTKNSLESFKKSISKYEKHPNKIIKRITEYEKIETEIENILKQSGYTFIIDGEENSIN